MPRYNKNDDVGGCLMIRWCLLMMCSVSIYAAPFLCEQNFPHTLQLDALENCDQNPLTLNTDLNVDSPEFDNLLADSALSHNNLGGAIINFTQNLRKSVYRSAVLSASPLCLQELVKKRHVSTIINLYEQAHSYKDELILLEQKIFQANGGEHYVRILNLRIDKLENHASFHKKITTVLKYIQADEGNVLVHCLAGEHLTGVVFGVLQKCYNKLPINVIEENAECHMGKSLNSYTKKSHDDTLTLIKEFPCPD